MKRLLIANRGEIALRIARTARRLGLQTVAVYSDPDADAPHARAMDASVRIGPASLAESYLSIEALLAAAREAGADAVHPGYGFLAESPEFAERCEASGLTFVGPSGAAMRALGNKAMAKRLLEGTGVPFLPGYHADDQRESVLTEAARKVGFPLMIKAAAGGGGRGMRLVLAEERFAGALHSARSEALAAFGSDEMLLERALLAPRHIEVQVFADALGGIVHLGERDCSVQRRHQKLIEEAPSPAVDSLLRDRLGAVAVTVARAASYAGAGTVEFLLDGDGSFYFIEMNTRLQVEHPVTEAIARVDLVEWQLRVARGERLPLAQNEIALRGHAIEARLCAEDPERDFLPQAGVLVAWEPPADVRVEHALESGIVISPYFDSMMAKIVSFGATREDARLSLARALETCVALGLPTNKSALVSYLTDPVFAAGEATTRFIEERALPHAGGEPEPQVVALAAALHFSLAAQRGDFGPWTAWSSSQLPESTVVLSFGDGPPRTVAIAPRSALCVVTREEERTYSVDFATLGTSGHARYRINEGAWRDASFAHVGCDLYFDDGRRSYATRDRGMDAATPAGQAGGDGFLRAPMSGRVISVAGRAGDTFAAGTPLVVVEAMKMEHAMTLPIDVILREITAAAGTQVHGNDILLAYEPATR